MKRSTEIEKEAFSLRSSLTNEKRLSNLQKTLILCLNDFENVCYIINKKDGVNIETCTAKLFRKIIANTDCDLYREFEQYEEYTISRKELTAYLKLIAPSRQELIDIALATL